jgi:glycosyltransferase involved in cell wall biosynthesis
VGPIVERILSLEGLVDQVLVTDAGSADGTAEVAERAGAEVRPQTD